MTSIGNDDTRTIRLGEPSPSQNDIRATPGRATYYRATSWRERTQTLANGYRLAHRLQRETRPCEVRVTRFVTSPRRLLRDTANLIGGCKPIIDGLVRGGLLVDDSDRWMRATYAQRIGEVAHTLIEIIPDVSQPKARPRSARRTA